MPTFGRANHRKSPGAVSPYRPLNLEKETRGGAPLLMTQSSQSKSLFFSCSDPLANKYIIQSITCNFGLSSRRAAIAKCVQKEIPSELFHGRNAGRRSATKRNHQREICTLSLGAINPEKKIIINHENAISLSLNDNSRLKVNQQSHAHMFSEYRRNADTLHRSYFKFQRPACSVWREGVSRQSPWTGGQNNSTPGTGDAK